MLHKVINSFIRRIYQTFTYTYIADIYFTPAPVHVFFLITYTERELKKNILMVITESSIISLILYTKVNNNTSYLQYQLTVESVIQHMELNNE